jgi:hypothetical protein
MDGIVAYPLRDTFCDDGNGLDLGVFHQFHGGAVDRSRRGKVDDRVHVGMLRHGLAHILVYREKSLARTPVPGLQRYQHGSQCLSGAKHSHLADELTAEGVDDTGDGRGGALADEVEVEHALHGSRLHTTVLLSIGNHDIIY